MTLEQRAATQTSEMDRAAIPTVGSSVPVPWTMGDQPGLQSLTNSRGRAKLEAWVWGCRPAASGARSSAWHFRGLKVQWDPDFPGKFRHQKDFVCVKLLSLDFPVCMELVVLLMLVFPSPSFSGLYWRC